MSESFEDIPVIPVPEEDIELPPDESDIEEVIDDEFDDDEVERSLPQEGSDDDPGSLMNH